VKFSNCFVVLSLVTLFALQGTNYQQQPGYSGNNKQQRLSHPGGVGSGSSKALGPGAGQHLASKAGMLQEQQLHARSGHHGMQISSAR
jgi:hypothetical protein